MVWHEYTREGRVKHWDDFSGENVEKGVVHDSWSNMNDLSLRRLRHMLQEEDNGIDLGEYGLGTVRTHRDFELYAGIDFDRRRLHPKSKEGIDPPINDTSDWSKIVEKDYRLKLNIPMVENFKFIYVGVETKSTKVLFRHDLTEYLPTIEVEIKSTEEPYMYVVWPMSKSGEWMDRTDVLFTEDEIK